MRRSIVLLVASAIAVTSCGSGRKIEGLPPALPDDIVLYVYAESGFPSPDDLLDQRPLYELGGNHRLTFFAVQPAAFPPPLIPQLHAVDLEDKTFDEVLRLIDESGLPETDVEINRDAEGRVLDGSTTVFDYFDGQDHHVFSVLGLGDDALSGDPRLGALRDLQRLLDITAGSSTARPAAIERLQVIAVEDAPSGDPNDETVDWSLPVRLDEMDLLSGGARCAVLDGARVTATIEAIGNAHAHTLFAAPDANFYRLLVRPLLHSEQGCMLPSAPGA